jgi:hypothetical protein
MKHPEVTDHPVWFVRNDLWVNSHSPRLYQASVSGYSKPSCGPHESSVTFGASSHEQGMD